MTTMIVVPVLGRPHRVEPLLASIAAATPEPHGVLFVANDDDLAELAAIDSAGADVLTVPKAQVSYPCKVNAAYRASTQPFLFLAADDLDFHPGWLTEAFSKLAPGVGVVGTNDLGNPRVIAGEHSTHSLVTRSYIDVHGASADGPGTVMHEGYRHWFCDDELVGLAKSRGAYAHAGESIVEHLHPYHGKAPKDRTYRLGERRRDADRRLHERRRTAWT